MNFVEMMTENDTLTKNGAVTNSTSHNHNVDLFFLAGACRNESVQKIETVLTKSYEQDRLKTLKIIFWAGDIRQGAGERRFFKLALNWLSKNHPDDIQNNLVWIPEFSRWDVIFDLAMENEILFSFIIANLVDTGSKGHGLLCKWLPRKSVVTDKKKEISMNGESTVTKVTRKKRSLYSGLAGKICKRLNITPKQYRKILVEGTKVVEQQMCAKKWNEIDYSKIPSVAINKYNKAWYRNDEERFKKYIEDVKSGKSKINASAIFPHDIIKDAIDSGWYSSNSYSGDFSIGELDEAKVAQWNALPNWLGDTTNSMIPMCDVSGSMSGLPIQISLALGLYISERNEGPFKDCFITFTSNPHFQYLKGSISNRLKQICGECGYNTDFVRAFEVILEKAVSCNLPQEQMPKMVLAISDMEFDNCGSRTNFDTIRQMYENAGYQMPQMVFWNVNGRVGNVPVTVNQKGVALISGASPSIIKSVLTSEISPVKIMDRTIESERYSIIK